jgi:lactate racemase
MQIDLPYGSVRYPLAIAGREVEVLAALEPPAPALTAASLLARIGEALAQPLRAPPLEALAPPGSRVTLIVSDVSRREPRAAFVEAIRAHLPGVRWTIAIATGTHGPCLRGGRGLEDLGLSAAHVRDALVIDHDGHAEASTFALLGTTSRGTPVRVHPCLVDADLVIATGCIRPHYFAGFGAGVKALFPGLGDARAVRINHRLKTAPGARAGVVEGNPCRDDLEEAVALLATPKFLVNGVCGPRGDVHAVVAGDVTAAFRAGAEIARPWFTVQARRAPVVIASDGLPVTATLYQAAKIAAATAPLVEEGGTLVVVAECGEGLGPGGHEVVNEAILRIGVLPRLPRGARLVLVSALDPATVRETLVEPAATVAEVLRGGGGRVTVVPSASQFICEGYS